MKWVCCNASKLRFVTNLRSRSHFQINDLNSPTWTRTSKSKTPANHKNLDQNRYFISKDHQDRPSQRFSQRKPNWLAAKQTHWPLLWFLSLLKSQILMFLGRGLLQHFPQIETHVSWPSSRERREEKTHEVNQSQVLYGAQMQRETSWMKGPLKWNVRLKQKQGFRFNITSV